MLYHLADYFCHFNLIILDQKNLKKIIFASRLFLIKYLCYLDD